MNNKLKKDPDTVGPKRREYNDATPEEQELLRKIAFLESSEGQNLDHDQIRSPDSIHFGDTAVGKYGLMPNTIDQITKIAPRMNNASPELRQVGELPPEEQAEIIKSSPDLEEESALNLLRMIKRAPVTDEQAAYMWQYGHNKVPEPNKIQNNERTIRFKALKNQK